MSRNGRLFLITHLYPLGMAIQMQWGSWTPVWNVLFQITPVLFIFMLLCEWKKTSSIKLSWHERQFINYFIFCFVILHIYYIACLFASNKWIKTHNIFVIWFTVITIIFYTYINVARKIKYR
jgi:hypothetical protein